MDLRQLQHFVAIVEAGGQTKAAQSVGVTQQALSKSLSRLEMEVGARLIERTPKGVVPTRVGQRLLESAAAILAESGRFNRDVAVLMGRGPASLVIGLSPIAAAGDIGRRVGRFQAANATVKLDVESGLEAQFSRLLLTGVLDIGVAASAEPADPLIISQTVATEDWVVTGRAGHPLLKAATSLADLAQARWLWGPKPAPLEAAIAASFRAASLPALGMATRTTSLIYAMNIIQQEDLLCILPRSIVAGWPGVIHRNLGGDAWSTDMILMRRRRAATSRLELALIDAIAAP